MVNKQTITKRKECRSSVNNVAVFTEKNLIHIESSVSVYNYIHEKFLDSDWLRAVQFKCNTSAKSVTPVQKV